MWVPRQSARCHANDPCRVRRIPLRARAGFSLIELLVTFVLLLILTSMMWGFGSASHQHQQKKLCQQNLSKIYLAMEIYANDNAGTFPETNGVRTSEGVLDVLVPHYTVDTSIFICPGSKDSALPAGESFRNRRISYAYCMGRRIADAREVLMSDKQVDTRPKSTGDLVFSTTGKPPGNNHSKYGGNFLFCDGHMESSPDHLPFSLVLTQGVVLLNPKP